MPEAIGLVELHRPVTEDVQAVGRRALVKNDLPLRVDRRGAARPEAIELVKRQIPDDAARADATMLAVDTSHATLLCLMSPTRRSIVMLRCVR